MRARHRNRPLSILFAVAVLAMLFSSCAPPTAPVPSEPPSAEPTYTAVPEQPAAEPADTPVPKLPEVMLEPDANCQPLEGSPTNQPLEVTTGSHFVFNQVILTGPADQFNQSNQEFWQGQLQEQGISLVPLRSCDLGILGPGPTEEELSRLSEFQHPDDRPFLFPFQDLPNREDVPIETRLYQVIVNEEDYPDLTFVKAFPLIAQTTSQPADGDEPSYVYADPNYLVGPLEAGTPCADPEKTAANPFTVGGSPFTVGGSASDPTGAPASPDIFWKQWALEQIQVTEPDGTIPMPGDGVAVTVFDTSPFPESGPAYSEPIANIDPPFDLHLRFPTIVNLLNPRPAKSQDVSSHGLFAAGLVHAVAPGSDIYLVQVLNDYGCGDLYTLNTAISGFMSSLQTLPQTEQPQKLVLSLSLGVQQPVAKELEEQNWPEEIVSLETVVHDAITSGAVVVAAAGNESQPPGPAARMQLPAAFPDVIGVAASTLDRTASCYTNNGDVGAPGGDGGPQPNRPCAPLATLCALGQWDCPWGVVSLSRDNSEIHYQFWAGTSFAAPLVSGQAAALLSQPTALGSPTEVMERIFTTAVPPAPSQSQLGHGIIDVSSSLTP